MRNNNMPFLEWWSYLNGDGDPTSRKSGPIKQLRQCKRLREVYFCEAFGNLRSRLDLPTKDEPLWQIKTDRVAMTSYVLSHVRQHDDSMSVGWQCGTASEGKNTPPVSEDRLRRLVKIRRETEMMPHFRRLVELLGKRVNVMDLSGIILGWGTDWTMKRLAFDYYDALHGITKAEKDARAKARTKAESDANSDDE